jgi:hypothetical protein
MPASVKSVGSALTVLALAEPASGSIIIAATTPPPTATPSADRRTTL